MTKIRSSLGWRRQDIRSLGTWHFAEKVAKTSGIMALAVLLGVAMLALMDAIKKTELTRVSANKAEMQGLVSIRAAQPLLFLYTISRSQEQHSQMPPMTPTVPVSSSRPKRRSAYTLSTVKKSGQKQHPEQKGSVHVKLRETTTSLFWKARG
jgi:hypothetical protein